MKNSTLIALSAGLALGLFSAPAAADDLDDTLRIIGNVFPVHHTGRILVCYNDAGVAPTASPVPDNAPDEIIATGLSEADLAQLLEDGFELLQQGDAVPTLSRLPIPRPMKPRSP